MAAAPCTRLESATCICTAMYPPEEMPDTVKVEPSAPNPGNGSAAAAAADRAASSSSAAKNLTRTVESGDARAGMHRRAAQPQAFDRGAVARKLGQRTHPEHLVERELGMVRLAFRPALGLRQFLRRQQLSLARHGLPPMLGQHGEDSIAELGAIRTLGGVLDVHVEAMLLVAARFDVRLPRHPAMLGIVVGALEVIERGGDRQRAKTWRAVELHAQACRHVAAPHMAHRAHELRVEPARL